MEDEAGEERALSRDGYSIQVLGYDHQPRTDTEALVEMPRNSKYQIRLINNNDHICMCKLELDGIDIGTFLLHEYTYCDLERPADRPLNFVFCLPEPESPVDDPKNRKAKQNERKRSSAAEQLGRSRSNIVAVFMPETGSRTLQFDVRCDAVGRSQRLEMANECTAQELFDELRRDFGEEMTEAPAVILHWTTAEYDSPVDDVLTADMRVALSNCKRKDDPLRKMCLIKIRRLNVEVEDEGITQAKVTELTSVPTFGDVFSTMQSMGFEDNRIWYFLSSAGRLLGSLDWLQSSTFVYQLLHRDEVLFDGETITIRATSETPNQCSSVFARVLSGTIHELRVSLDMTVREVRHQLGAKGGPWGEDPKWLYGGTLLDNGRSLRCYGIRHRDTIDIVLRLRNQGMSGRPLQKKEPIVVETEVEVDTVCLIRKEPSSLSVDKKRSSPKMAQRGGTVLKYRSSQQFVEVDPIDVDNRFFVSLLVSIIPDDDILLETEEDPDKPSRTCTVM